MWLDVIVALAGLWGVFLLLFGRRILRPSVAMTGLVLSALTAGLVGRQFFTGETVIVCVVVGGIIGVLVAWATYRLWMALLLAVMLALVVPWGVLAWHGAPPSPIEQRLGAVGDPDLGQRIADPSALGDHFAAAPPPSDGAAPGDEPSQPTLMERAGDAADELGRELRDWWINDVSAATRWTAMTATAAFAVGGFVVGLIVPELAAALATSLVGAGLILASVMRLTGRYATGLEEWMPAGPRMLLIVLGAMTVVGAVLQWTVLRRRGED